MVRSPSLLQRVRARAAVDRADGRFVFVGAAGNPADRRAAARTAGLADGVSDLPVAALEARADGLSDVLPCPARRLRPDALADARPVAAPASASRRRSAPRARSMLRPERSRRAS
jgi:hypothetical protein